MYHRVLEYCKDGTISQDKVTIVRLSHHAHATTIEHLLLLKFPSVSSPSLHLIVHYSYHMIS